MSTQAAGTPPGEGQPQPGNPQPAGQPLSEPQTPPPAQGAPQPPVNPPAADIEAKLKEFEEKNRFLEESNRYFQSQFHTAQQQLQAVTGATPKPDPHAEDVRYWVEQGYAEKDARAMVDFVNRKVTPIQQENAALKASLSATGNVQTAMQQAMQAEPELFQNQDIVNATYAALQQAALAGETNFVSAAYAQQIAMSEWVNKNKPWKSQPNGQQPPPLPQPRVSFLGSPGGYTPAPQPQPRVNGPNQYDAEIAERFKIQS